MNTTKQIISFTDMEKIYDVLESIQCDEMNRCINSLEDCGICTHKNFIVIYDKYGLLED